MSETVPPASAAMDARFSRLEDTCKRIKTILERIDERTRKLEIAVAELTGRVSQLPSTWQMMTAIIGGQVALAALVLAVLKAFGTR